MKLKISGLDPKTMITVKVGMFVIADGPIGLVNGSLGERAPWMFEVFKDEVVALEFGDKMSQENYDGLVLTESHDPTR